MPRGKPRKAEDLIEDWEFLRSVGVTESQNLADRLGFNSTKSFSDALRHAKRQTQWEP